jgi:hypothetical protein
VTKANDTTGKSKSPDLIQEVSAGYQRGWRFTPVKGKRPFLKGWAKAEPETLDQAAKWAAEGDVGIRTGRVSGINIVDVDQSSIPTGLPTTVTARTPGGGFHLYYRSPGHTVRNSVRFASHCDIRADGGQCVFPGSAGGAYRWMPSHAPGEIDLAPWPVAFLNRHGVAADGSKIAKTTTGQQNTRQSSHQVRDRYTASAIDGELKNVAAATEGSRNSTLNAASFAIGRFTGAGRLDRNDAEAMLLAATTLPESEALATIHSGLDAGEKSPCFEGMPNGNGKPSMQKMATPPSPDDTHSRPDAEPRERLAYQPFPVDALPPAVRKMVESVAKCTNTDPAMASLASLVILAACTGNRVSAMLKRGWTEPAVLWGAVVVRSGRQKTPVIKLMLRPVVAIFKEGRAQFAEEQRDYESDRARFEVDYASWKNAQRQGKVSDPPVEPDPPKLKRLHVSDVTTEKLACVLNDNPLGLLLERDELAGWVGGFDRYSGGRGSDQAAFLSMFDASAIVVDRKTAGASIFVERAAVSVLGGIQPGPLSRLMGRNERESGLLARMLLASPPERPLRWTDDELDEGAAQGWRDVLMTLTEAEPAVDDQGNPRPRLMPLSQAAKDLYVQWHDRHGEDTANADADDLAAHFAKLRGVCGRVALVVELATAAESGKNIANISSSSMRAAIRIVNWFKHEACRVYGAMAGTDDDRRRERLADWVAHRGGSVRAREMMKSGPRAFRGTTDLAREALAELVDHGFGEWQHIPSGELGGRPTDRFVLFDGTQNPPPEPENEVLGSASTNGSSKTDGDDLEWRGVE